MEQLATVQFLQENEFLMRTSATLQWLQRSFDVNNGHGSSAYYSPLKHPFSKWQRPYPETTGYIIETLLQYNTIYPELKLADTALGGGEWLLSLQLKNGAFPGGYQRYDEPSVFNTGQIIIGLIKAYEYSLDKRYFKSFRKAVHWLIASLDETNTWRTGAYVTNYTPAYYTRVIWPVLMANIYLQEEKITERMRSTLVGYQQKVTSVYSVRDWSAFPGEKAFTHFIAYTIRGFMESAILLKDDNLFNVSKNMLEKGINVYKHDGRLAGSYDEEWKGDYSFTCVTGNCQMALNLARLYQETKEEHYLEAAVNIFTDIISAQRISDNPDRHGAIPGSVPLWGKYLRFRYPNHAAKFFLDACLLLRTCVNR